MKLRIILTALAVCSMSLCFASPPDGTANAPGQTKALVIKQTVALPAMVVVQPECIALRRMAEFDYAYIPVSKARTYSKYAVSYKVPIITRAIPNKTLHIDPGLRNC